MRPQGTVCEIEHLQLEFDQRQKLLRLVIAQVRVTGCQIEIRLRIPLDGPPHRLDQRVSTKDRLRSLHEAGIGVMQEPVAGGEAGVAGSYRNRPATVFTKQIAEPLSVARSVGGNVCMERPATGSCSTRLAITA